MSTTDAATSPQTNGPGARPIAIYRSGSVGASLWQGNGLSVSFWRKYRDQNGQDAYAQSFYYGQIPNLVHVANQVMSAMETHGDGSYRPSGRRNSPTSEPPMEHAPDSQTGNGHVPF